jgi:chemotaxis response regulator CheB
VIAELTRPDLRPAPGIRLMLPPYSHFNPKGAGGVGASAGGLEAFTQFLSQLPEKTGMAFVLVQHLAPTHESHLAELLSKATPLPIAEVSDGMAVSPEHIYVIPPDTSLALEKGVLLLTPPPLTRRDWARPPKQ